MKARNRGSSDSTGLRHKLYKLPKPVRYTSSKPLNYTPKPGNYTNIWNHLDIQLLKPLKYTPKPLKYINKKVKTQNIYNWNHLTIQKKVSCGQNP